MATPPQPTPVHSKVDDLLPAPFVAFQIAKYSITNAQYAKFIGAGGYQQQK